MTPRRFIASTRPTSAVGALAFATVALAPALAAACPVCFSARDGTRLAYVGTAILMSLLPLAMFGVVVWWVRRAIRQHDERERAGASALAPAATVTTTTRAPSRTEAASATT